MAIVFLLPLAIAPGWLFYYDVTPKAAVVLAGLAALALAVAWKPESTLLIWTSPYGRWNIGLAGALVAALGISAALSPYGTLAWTGSMWRRSGAIVQIATLLAALLTAALASKHVLGLTRAIAAAGLLASSYAILQYFGWDPWLDAASYHVGEGEHQIVRPPGTMGHANYLSAVLLWAVFAGAGLWRGDTNGVGRRFGAISAGVSAIAVVLCGSRGALLGLLVGTGAVLWVLRPRIRAIAALAVVAVLALGLFYISPAGERLRARIFWIADDTAGGARLLLWRDSLHMSRDRIATGFGPDTFAAAFPQYQSAELARAYPDFYHESPHNMFLDVLVDQGLAGLLTLVGLTALGLIAGWKAARGGGPALFWLGGFIAAVIAQQFIVFLGQTAFFFFLAIAILCNWNGAMSPPQSSGVPIRLACVAMAIAALTAAGMLVSADHTLARIRNLLDQKQPEAAAGMWQSTPPRANLTADIYFSRRFAEIAVASRTTAQRLRFAQVAGNAAARATQNPEQRQNAFYNLATIQALADDLPSVEASLRGAMAASPTWYKPHWALARALRLAGRHAEAREEAEKALDLNGRRDREVIGTMEEILRSPGF